MAINNDNLENKLIPKNKVKAIDSINELTNNLIVRFKNNLRSFTYASSFGQIILVLQNHVNNIFYYINDSATQTNFKTANRIHSVHGLARLQGHNAFRGSSARGSVVLVRKPSINIDIAGDKIHIPNYTKIQNLENGLQYTILMNTDFKTFNIDGTKEIQIPIVEGVIETHTFTGTGENIQTYELPNLQFQMYDDSFVEVFVNGKLYEQFVSLYEIPYGIAGCLVKTGMTSGIDVIFGKKNFQEIPPLGSEIKINVLTTNGKLGNIFNSKTVWKLNDTCYDGNGNELNLDDIFYVNTNILPSLGADAEDINLTKILAPNISRSFILHDKKSINYFFRKMNYFSSINIFKKTIDNINEYSIYLIPSLINRLTTGDNYFTISQDKFLLLDHEKSQILSQIQESGIKSANITIELINPIIQKFAMMIYCELENGIDADISNMINLRQNILNVISNYLLNRESASDIIHSEVVSIINGLDDIYSAKVIFLSQDNKFIDSLGNIKVDNNRIAVVRGDWTDSNGVYFKDEFDPLDDYMGCVNINIEKFNL